MLTYSVKLSDDNFKRDKLVWSEKFVAPDLSFVSGVTSQQYHIDKNDYISASIGKDTNFSRLSITSQNVIRSGYIVIVDKEYKIKSGRKSTITDTDSVEFKYVDINGVYYYITGESGEITVKNWLKEVWDSDYNVEVIEGDATARISGDVVKLDTIVWIEDDTVTIDGYKYLYDKDDPTYKIKYYDGGRSLEPKEITACDDIYHKCFKNVSKYKYVTKFILRKSEDSVLDYDRLSYCTYFYYVYYNDNYCPVKKVGDSYKCYINDSPYDVTIVGTTPARISQLKSQEAYVTIGGVDFPVEHAIQNANGGDEIAVYLIDDTHNLSLGDKITLSYGDGEIKSSPVYSLNGSYFVIYNNVKYMVEEGIADTVLIGNDEYDVSYPNGKIDGVDALVAVGEEVIPMKINGNTLQRYGNIIVPGVPASTEASYNIKSYSGVTIDEVTYRVIDSSTKYIITPKQGSMEFNIVSIEGSSLLICEPNLNYMEYDDDFRDSMSASICDFFVSNANYTRITFKNRAFGSRVITPDLGFVVNGSSSSEYDNIFDNLVLFTNNGYIQLDLPLTMNVANNVMQEDIIERDFFDAEKKKAINPIVDMEKDVYIPMFMKTKYTGSTTTFHPISEIEVNLHFRTRNMDNWKVNDGTFDLEVSGASDNWFCTDFYPYKQMLEDVRSADTAIMNSSDLMGLLYYDNDDVFYQKDNIAKTFLRFSYYDTTDPNTQSLLCTSTVFMDEHAMYKKYIDNSRRNIRDYGLVQEQEYETSAATDGSEYVIIPQRVVDNFSGNVINRISVSSECIGRHKNRRKAYNYGEIALSGLTTDSNRVSSRFIITNKYATDTSSEGFYIYMFREYSENLHPKPIYMKVEFNHAGVGRTIPFIVPMNWKSGNSTNEKIPDRKLTLSGNDLDYLKEGYPLTYVYSQTYIPLYAVYDYKNKQFAYVFDDRYVTREGSKIKLNLFELKIKDEKKATINARADIRNNNIERAVINVNPNQFSSNI